MMTQYQEKQFNSIFLLSLFIVVLLVVCTFLYMGVATSYTDFLWVVFSGLIFGFFIGLITGDNKHGNIIGKYLLGYFVYIVLSPIIIFFLDPETLQLFESGLGLLLFFGGFFMLVLVYAIPSILGYILGVLGGKSIKVLREQNKTKNLY